VAVGDLTLQHVEELEPGMLEDREDIRLVGQGDEIGLNDQRPMGGVAEQLILVAGPGPPPLDGQALAGLDEGCLIGLLEGAEKRGHRHVKGAGERLERRQGGRGGAVLDLRQHAGRDPRRLGQLGDGQPEFFPEIPDLAADRLLEMAALGRGDPMGVLVHCRSFAVNCRARRLLPILIRPST
jgi:hypothetical protein